TVFRGADRVVVESPDPAPRMDRHLAAAAERGAPASCAYGESGDEPVPRALTLDLHVDHLVTNVLLVGARLLRTDLVPLDSDHGVHQRPEHQVLPGSGLEPVQIDGARDQGDGPGVDRGDPEPRHEDPAT